MTTRDLVTSSSTLTGDIRWRALVAEKIAPNATDYDIDYLAAVCRRLGLSPFTSPPQIVLIARYDRRLDREVFRPQVTVDGRLALAVRSGHVVGIEGPQYTGLRDQWTDQHGQRIWVDLWDFDEEKKYPRAARYFVYVKDWTRPVNGTAVWQEFAQADKQGKLLPLWLRMPSVMLAKSALSLALRRSGVDALAADVAVAYEGDVDDLASPSAGEIPGPDGHPPPSGSGPQHRIIEDDGTFMVCACGEKFSTVGGAYARHRHNPDEPPAEIYDSTPESRGYDPDLQPASYENPDDGRPFDEEET